MLGLLDAAGEATPYDLKQIAATAIGDFWSMPHAQLYAEPERLAAAGLLRERRESSGRRRKYYKLTAAGRRALRDWVAEPTEQQIELRDPGLLKIFFGSDPRAMAAAQLPVRRAKLEKYEELLAQIEGHVPEGMVLALRVGISHEREWVRFWSELQEGEEGE